MHYHTGAALGHTAKAGSVGCSTVASAPKFGHYSAQSTSELEGPSMPSAGICPAKAEARFEKHKLLRVLLWLDALVGARPEQR
jgi:hypothetical protein